MSATNVKHAEIKQLKAQLFVFYRFFIHINELYVISIQIDWIKNCYFQNHFNIQYYFFEFISFIYPLPEFSKVAPFC